MSQVTGNIQTSQLVRGSGDFRSDSGSPSRRPLIGQEGGSETPLTHPTAPSLLGQPKRMGESLRSPTRRPPLGRPVGEAVVGWERSPLSHQPASSRPGQPERGREGWRESPLPYPPSSSWTLWQPERQREGGSSPPSADPIQRGSRRVGESLLPLPPWRIFIKGDILILPLRIVPAWTTEWVLKEIEVSGDDFSRTRGFTVTSLDPIHFIVGDKQNNIKVITFLS